MRLSKIFVPETVMGYNLEAAPNTFLSQNISKNATIFLGAEITSLTKP
jgi:hypothetical protein